MEGNKEEARRAMDIAERKLSENDYVGAKEFVNKAQNLYPNLDGLEQVLMIINVYISASNGESDWYGIIGVDPLADDETVKKQYKKLALLLHPDKNKFYGAEEAFKLVSEAWCLLSDKDKRFAYDLKRKSKQKKSWKQQKPPNPHEPPSYYYKPKPKPKPKPEPESSSKQEKTGTFWTVCNECNTYYEYMRANYLNKTLPCGNCGKGFVATEIIPEMINWRLGIRMRPSSVQPTSKNTSDNTSSSTTSAACERMRRWFEPDSSSSKGQKINTFWTMCNRCKTYCKYPRDNCLNKTLPCPNCYQDFLATEIIPEIINGSPVIRLSANSQSTSKSNSDTSSCGFKAERLFDGEWLRKQRGF